MIRTLWCYNRSQINSQMKFLCQWDGGISRLARQIWISFRSPSTNSKRSMLRQLNVYIFKKNSTTILIWDFLLVRLRDSNQLIKHTLLLLSERAKVTLIFSRTTRVKASTIKILDLIMKGHTQNQSNKREDSSNTFTRIVLMLVIKTNNSRRCSYNKIISSVGSFLRGVSATKEAMSVIWSRHR